MLLPTSTVGRKLLMALTGQFMIIYVLAHVLGNSTIYSGAINAYAEGLRHWPFVIVLWSSRFLLLFSIILHACSGIIITLENRKAKPEAYAITSRLSATFAGRNMIWTGALIGAFLVYHLLHFTVQAIHPQFSASRHSDALGRPDVFMMVLRSFQQTGIVSFYILSVSGLLLHLSHGIQSSFQTWGLNNERSFPVITRGGLIAAVALFFGYAAIPVVIVMGVLK